MSAEIFYTLNVKSTTQHDFELQMLVTPADRFISRKQNF